MQKKELFMEKQSNRTNLYNKVQEKKIHLFH